MNRFTVIRYAFLGIPVFIGIAPPVAAQQDYPVKPIRLIIGFAAGGTTDIVGRLIAQRISDVVRQQVVIENRPGAAANIAMEMAAKAAPDGYALYLASPAYVINPSLYAKVPYRVEDFAPVSLNVTTPMVLIVTNAFPAKSAQEFIQNARANPDKYNYGTAGSGSSSHLAAALFLSVTNTRLTHVPYKSGPAVVTDLIAGQLNMMTYPVPEVAPYIKAGKMRALGVSAMKRSAVLPEVPTLHEEGVTGFTVMNWFGVTAPARTPREIIAKLNAAIQRGFATPQSRERIAELGLDLVNSSPDDFGAFIREEYEKWGKVIRTQGINAD